MYHRFSGKTKRVLAAGVATTIALSTIIVPAAASEDYSFLSITARVEEYISESPAEDPVAELIGTDVLSAEKKSENFLTTPIGKKSNKAAADDKSADDKTDDTTEADEEKETGDEAEKENSSEAGEVKSDDEDETEVSEEEVTETESEAQEETTEAPEPVQTVKYPQFKDRCIVTTGVLNIRAEASVDAEVVGQIERAGIALVEESGNGWTKIGSGICEGYACNDYLAFGDEAGAWAERNGISKYIKVNETGLRVRQEPNTDAEVIYSLYQGETYKVLRDDDEWVKIELTDGTPGYVSADYVEVRFDTPKAKTMAQIEEMRKAEEEDARREQERKEAAAKAAEEAKKVENNSSSSMSSGSGSSNSSNEAKATSAPATTTPTTSTPTTAAPTTTETVTETKKSSGTNSQLRAEMVAYAKQFLGNPYVYGGTSLTNGTDCSGFTMRIYEHFGYKIPRAGGQRTFCKQIKVSEAQPGDLIFYPGHVTMYIGGGQVIHASSASTGIIISSLSYSGTPEFATNIIDYY